MQIINIFSQFIYFSDFDEKNYKSDNSDYVKSTIKPAKKKREKVDEFEKRKLKELGFIRYIDK